MPQHDVESTVKGGVSCCRRGSGTEGDHRWLAARLSCHNINGQKDTGDRANGVLLHSWNHGGNL